MSDSNREARREQIIDAVVRITTRGGLQAATFRTVAKEAGVSVRLVQYYFGNKDQLLADSLRRVGMRAAARITDAVERLGPDPPPKDKITTIFEQFLPIDETRREAMLVFIALRTASLTDPSLRSSDEVGLDTSLIAVIEEELERAGAQGTTRQGLEPNHEAMMLVTTLSGIANSMLAGSTSEPDGRETLEYVLDLSIPDQ